jgi:hypothetical protein
MNARTLLFSLLLLATLACSTPQPAAAQAQDYTFQTLDVPGADTDIQLTWMNDTGLIVQQYQSPTGAAFPANVHTAIQRAGAWTVIDVPGATFTGGSNANASGQVALTYTLADGILHVALYDRGKHLYQPDIPGYHIGVQGLNDRGQLAASAIDAGGVEHGFVGNSSAFTVFDYPDSKLAATTPFMVNTRGIVVGRYILSDGTWHAFLYDGTSFKNIDVPGAVRSTATGINDSNQIVGVYRLTKDGPNQGFLFRGGQYTTLNFPGSTRTILDQINNAGDMAGTYTDASGKSHGFIATRVGGR